MSIININVGVLGHVDSGKTSLCKVLSTTSSTACFDKNPQSQARGITLDLGFSSFQLTASEIAETATRDRLHLGDDAILQFTLVDCPGHASLIRTIICGAQIIDVMVLVVDVTKGIQTQTAECLVIGEILCGQLLIVLNKLDLVPASDRAAVIAKMRKRLSVTMTKTSFKQFRIVEVAANPGGGSEENPRESRAEPMGINEFLRELVSMIDDPLPRRISGAQNPLIFAIDHCFPIRGQGTVLTGTLLSGSLAIGDILHIPALETEKKVKSIQMFRKPVSKAIQGDRIGVCVAQLDAGLLERGLACHAATNKTQLPLQLMQACLVRACVIGHYRLAIRSKSKLHFSICQDTVMGQITLFAGPSTPTEEERGSHFDWSREYRYLDSFSSATNQAGLDAAGESLWVLVELERAVVCARDSLVIAAKLDTDIHSNVCRLAFHGRVLWMNASPDFKVADLPRLKIYKWKSRSGIVERVVDSRTVIVRSLFKKETNIEVFQRLRVVLTISSTEEASEGDKPSTKAATALPGGYIEGNFGQSGKVKIVLDDDLPVAVFESFAGSKKKKGKPEIVESSKISIKVELKFKRYLFDLKKKIIQ